MTEERVLKALIAAFKNQPEYNFFRYEHEEGDEDFCATVDGIYNMKEMAQFLLQELK